MSDPLTLALILGGAGIQAAGNIAGGLIAGQGQGGDQALAKSMLAAGYNPSADPLLNALRLETLSQLGLPVESVLNAASPIAALSNAVATGLAGTIQQKDISVLSEAMRVIQGTMAGTEITKTGSNVPYPALDTSAMATPELTALIETRLGPKQANQVKQALVAAGYQSIGQLVDAERSYRMQTEGIRQSAASYASAIREGRVNAQQSIAALLSDFPRVTETDIQRVSETERQRMRESLLQQANVGGFNPAAGLSEIERDVDPIARAVTLLGGKLDLAKSALGTLTGALNAPLELAATGAQTGTNAALGTGSLAVQQANALAQLNARAGGGQESVGTGLAAGLGAAGEGLMTYALLQRLSNQQPGTGDRGDIDLFPRNLNY